LVVSSQLKDALAKIAATGLRGKGTNEVAVRLLEEGLQRVVTEVKSTKEILRKL